MRYQPFTSASPDRRTVLITAVSAYVGFQATRLFAQSAAVLPRQAATKFERDLAQLQVLRDAVAILKAKDGSTPAADGWFAIANPHIEHCFTGDSREIHFCRWFLPWHRAYLLAMERRLQNVVSEPKLRLPYWNWFSVDDIPEAFTRKTYTAANGGVRDNPLFDSTRAIGPDQRRPRPGVDGFSGDDAKRAPCAATTTPNSNS